MARAARRLGPGRLSAEEAAKLPDRLLDAAFELFTEQGFAETTMEQIARRAGASTKTLYSRFANKGEIMQAMVRRNVDRIVTRVGAGLTVAPESMGPRERLLSLGGRIAGAFDKETTGISRLTYAEAYRFPMLARLYDEVTGRGINVIGVALELWRQQGLLNDLDDPARAARLCFGLLTDEPRIRAVLGEPMSRAEIQAHVAAAVDLFLRGVGYAPEKGEGGAARKKPQRRPSERR